MTMTTYNIKQSLSSVLNLTQASVQLFKSFKYFPLFCHFSIIKDRQKRVQLVLNDFIREESFEKVINIFVFGKNRILTFS